MPENAQEVTTEAQDPKAAPQSTELDRADALDLAKLVATKQVAPEELLEAAIERAEAANPRFNFMAQKHYDYGRAAIAKGLPEGPFRGVPFLLKDVSVFIEGELTGCGSRYYTEPATYTSELVKRYERAGLVIFGKTTTPELGLTATTESLATGETTNPWNPARSAGGSSGGAAAAVAAGVIPAAHAADGGGSIRIPASCCGLFGLKPSRGRMPSGPMKTETWAGLAVPHVVSWTVRDSAAMLDATHGPDLGSSYIAPPPERPFLQEVGRAPGRLRIAFSVSTPRGSPVDPECVAAVQDAAKLCESLGHHVEEAAPTVDGEAIGRATSAITFAHLMAELQRQEAACGIPPSPDVLEKVTMVLKGWGAEVTGADYVRALETVQRAAIDAARFMQNFDILLTPTLAEPPVPLKRLSLSSEDSDAFFTALSNYVPFTSIYNVTGRPAMSVPLATSRSGLPIGVHFGARYGEEAGLFRLAGQLEQAAPWRDRRPY
jgi:amidase